MKIVRSHIDELPFEISIADSEGHEYAEKLVRVVPEKKV